MNVLLWQVPQLLSTLPATVSVFPLLVELGQRLLLWPELELFVLHSLPVFSSASPSEHPLA